MKVLQINSVCGYGSTGRIATDLYKVYEEAGHECVIAYGRGIAPDGFNTIKIGNKIDMYKHIAKARLSDKSGFGSKKVTEKFIEDVKKFDPDIVHLHNIHGYYLNIEILFNYLKKANKKVIWTLHDCWTFTGHCAYFDYVGCDKWKTACENCPQIKSYPKSQFIDQSKSNFTNKKEIFTGLKDMTIITPSKWLADKVKESYLKEYKVEVINNGIDLNIFKPTKSDFKEKYKISDKKIILGVASVWEQRKGLNYFIKLNETINDNYKIVLVGLTEDQKKKMPDNIIGITRTNNIKELVEIYSAAEVFFNPTLEDNYPTTNLEALACGTPVITFDTGGSPESVPKKCGEILYNKDIDISIFSNIDIDKDKIKSYISDFDKNKKFKCYLNFFS